MSCLFEPDALKLCDRVVTNKARLIPVEQAFRLCNRA